MKDKVWLKEFVGNSHWFFYRHLLEGGVVERKDTLNNINEALTEKDMIERHGDALGICLYGYKTLSIKK